MRLAVATVLLALLGAATAQADPQPVPQGFAANAALSRAASYVAGKTVTDYCARTQQQFDDALLAATGQGAGGAYSVVGSTQSFLSPPVCSWLLNWNARKKVSADNLARGLLALTHEAELLAGEPDESIADCRALAVMPQVIARYFPLRKVYTLHNLMRAAWDVHDGEADMYLENCPQR